MADDRVRVPPAPHIMEAQVLGVSELSDFLGYTKAASWKWSSLGMLPEADYPSVNGKPAWRRLTIIRWAAESGRLPEWHAGEGERFVPPEGPRIRRRESKAKPEPEPVSP